MIYAVHRENKQKFYAIQYDPNDMSRFYDELASVIGHVKILGCIQKGSHGACHVDMVFRSSRYSLFLSPWEWIIVDVSGNSPPYTIDEHVLENMFALAWPANIDTT